MSDIDSENLHVATWLQQAAEATPPRSGLPSASHLWWRAQIIRDLVANEQVIERATRSTRWMQALGLGLLCLLAALGLTWLTTTLLSGLHDQAASGGAPWGLLAGLLLGGTVLPLVGFTALWVMWREA